MEPTSSFVDLLQAKSKLSSIHPSAFCDDDRRKRPPLGYPSQLRRSRVPLEAAQAGRSCAGHPLWSTHGRQLVKICKIERPSVRFDFRLVVAGSKWFELKDLEIVDSDRGRDRRE